MYAIGSISRFHCVAFFHSLCLCVCVCVWATLPDLNKMDGWINIQQSRFVGAGEQNLADSGWAVEDKV